MPPEDSGSVLPWVAVFLVWLWGLVPRAVGQNRARLAQMDRELRRAGARLKALEDRSSHLHREVREAREQRHGVRSTPSQLEMDLASHLADIAKARQDVQIPKGGNNGR